MIRFLPVVIVLSISLSCSRQTDVIQLEGTWDLCLDSISDPHSVSPDLLRFPLSVSLPGTLDEAGIGDPVPVDTVLDRKVMLHLQRKVSFIGQAFYRRTVSIPSGWKGKRITMVLERVIWKSTVWVDGKMAGTRNSLSTPHEYDLSVFLPPGRHTLIIGIDNSRKFAISQADMAHAYTEETQIKWNGILGNFSLKAGSKDRIDSIALYPYYAGKSISGKITVCAAGRDDLALNIEVLNRDDSVLARTSVSLTGPNTAFRLDLPPGIIPWNEFSPELYQLSVTLETIGKVALDARKLRFGFRDLEARGRHLFLNGKRLFLRGTLECCIFPLTGHPPADTAGWAKVFTTAREYGLNHIRFHS